MDKEEAKKKLFLDKMSKKRKLLVTELKESKSVVARIPIEYYTTYRQIGEGDFKKGLKKAAYICDTSNPIDILMKDCSIVMDHLEHFYGPNHSKHFRNFPAVFRKFLITGKFDESFLEIKDENGKS